MREVQELLVKLGLDRYIDNFLDANIDSSGLANLSANDLRELGVRIRRHRNEILAATAELAEKTEPGTASNGANGSTGFRFHTELRLMERLWGRARGGLAQTVNIISSNEASKFQLVSAFRKSQASFSYRSMKFRGFENKLSEPLYPIRDHLLATAGITGNETDAAKVEKLRRLLPDSGANGHNLALHAAFLGFPLNGFEIPPTSSNDFKQAIFLSMQEQAIALSKIGPVLAIFEDAQWLDATTLEFFITSIPSMVDAKVMNVITARPEFEGMAKELQFARWLFLDQD